jgi:hypothetical protein
MKKFVVLLLLVVGLSNAVFAQDQANDSKRKSGTQMIAILDKAANQKMKIIVNQPSEEESLAAWTLYYDNAQKTFSFENGNIKVTSILEVGNDFLLLSNLADQVDMMLAKSTEGSLALIRNQLITMRAFTNIEQQENELLFYEGQKLVLVSRYVPKP